MEVRTIKDIDDVTWIKFKSLAASNNLKMGMMFKVLVESHSEKKLEFWKDIFENAGNISTKEAEELKRTISGIRKEYGFRK